MPQKLRKIILRVFFRNNFVSEGTAVLFRQVVGVGVSETLPSVCRFSG